MAEKKKTKSAKIDDDHVKQLKEMEEIVEKREEKIDAEISKRADEAFKIEERRVPGRETLQERIARETKERLEAWAPRTELGRDVLSGKIKNIDEIFEQNKKILEPEIVDI